METNENDNFNFPSGNEAPPPQQCDFSFPEKFEPTPETPVEPVNKAVAEEVGEVAENDTGHTAEPEVPVAEPDTQPEVTAQPTQPAQPEPAEVDPPEPNPPSPPQIPASEPEVVTEDVMDSSAPVVEETPLSQQSLPDTVPITDSQENSQTNHIEDSKENFTESTEETKEETKEEEKVTVEEVEVKDKGEEEEGEEPQVDEPEEGGKVEEGEEAPGHVDIREVKEEEEDHHDKEQQMETDEKVPEKPTKTVMQEKLACAMELLENFLRTKDEQQIHDCVSVLSQLKSLTDLIEDKLDEELAEKGKRGKRPKTKPAKGRGETAAKRSRNNASAANDSDSSTIFELANLKEIKGLAVFAKWPLSGWFYPGIVKDMALEDWKSPPANITVTFYDGLERELKSIHILPASLVPVSSILFDLDDEVDMTITAVDREDDNWVKFSLNNKNDESVERDFNKLAIKSASMKNIKNAIDSSQDGKRSKTVTEDNLVVGRRSRGKSTLFNEDYVSSSPRSTEKRKPKRNYMDENRSTPSKTPAKRRVKEEELSETSSPARSASKRRQVNGTKSTPRRKSTKGK